MGNRQGCFFECDSFRKNDQEEGKSISLAKDTPKPAEPVVPNVKTGVQSNMPITPQECIALYTVPKYHINIQSGGTITFTRSSTNEDILSFEVDFDSEKRSTFLCCTLLFQHLQKGALVVNPTCLQVHTGPNEDLTILYKPFGRMIAEWSMSANTIVCELGSPEQLSEALQTALTNFCTTRD